MTASSLATRDTLTLKCNSTCSRQPTSASPPSRIYQKNAKPFPTVLRKVRKRIETHFFQLCDHFLLIRNYAKNVDGLFARIIGKIDTVPKSVSVH